MFHGMSALQVAISIVGVGVLIAWHEFGHYVVARLLGVRVLRYSIGFGPRLWRLGFRRKDIDYQIGVVPIGGFVQMKGMTPLEEGAVGDPRSFIMRPRWVRFLVLAAGPGFNYLMGAALFFLYLVLYPSPLATTTVQVGVVAGAPAAAAGVEDGDFIVDVDGEHFDSVGEFKQLIGKKNGAPVTLDILRGTDQRVAIPVTPAPLGDGFVIGVEPEVRYPAASLGLTAAATLVWCKDATVSELSAIGALFRREPGVQLQSPVKIVSQMKDEIARGGGFFLRFLALLSVSIGLFNLLPVPALDGIKMLFLTVEGAIRRNLHAGFQVWVNALGLLALLGLMVVLMVRDAWGLIG